MSLRRGVGRSRKSSLLVSVFTLVIASGPVVGGGTAGAAVIQPVVTLSTTPTSPTYLGGAVILTATLDQAAAGTVNFSVNGGDVGCASQSVSTASAPYGATCLYTPPSASNFTVDASFTPADPTTYARAAANEIVVSVALAVEAPLRVTSLTGRFGSPLALAASGGSGSGALSFAVSDGTATHCQVSGNILTTTSAGTCLVNATQASDGNYLSITSSTAVVTIARIHPRALRLAALRGTFGASLRLITRGGSGSGALTFRVTGGTADQCRVSGRVLRAASAGTCLVRATQAASTDYLVNSSPLTMETFLKSVQSRVFLLATKGTFGVATPLRATGGKGTGRFSFTATEETATGCAIVRNGPRVTLVVKSAGRCLVKVTKLADRNYRAVSSAPTTIVVARAPQAPIALFNTVATIGSPFALTVSGGNGSGLVTFAVAGGTAQRCVIKGMYLDAATGGTCRVTATKDGDHNYVSTRTVGVVTFQRLNQAGISLSSAHGQVGAGIVLVVRGGRGRGAVKFVVTGGTSKSCTVKGSVLVSKSVGTCVVTAMKKGDGTYRASSSGPVTFTFTRQVVAIDITASPSSGLLAGAEVRITGTGYQPSERVLIAQCAVGARALNQCDRATAATVVANATGALPTTYLVAATGHFGSETCGTTALDLTRCEVHVSSGAFTNAKIVGLTFVHVAPGRHLFVTPSRGLKNGDVITISGTGFTPSDRVYYAECLIGNIVAARCNLTTYKFVFITPTGEFPTTKLTVATGSIGTHACGTSASNLDACEISVANTSLGDEAKFRIVFAKP